MANNAIHFETRQGTGKSVTRKLRSNNKIPGVVYGRGDKTFAISIDGEEFKTLVSQLRGKLLIAELIPPDGKSFRAAIKEIQRHPITEEFLNVDFQKVHPGQMLHVKVPITAKGTPAGLKMGGLLEHIRYELDVRGPVSKLPLNIEVDISDLDVGDAIRVKDIEFAPEVEVYDPAEGVIVTVISPRRAAAAAAMAEPVEAVEGEETEGEAGEGEVGEAAEADSAQETESKE